MPLCSPISVLGNCQVVFGSLDKNPSRREVMKGGCDTADYARGPRGRMRQAAPSWKWPVRDQCSQPAAKIGEDRWELQKNKLEHEIPWVVAAEAQVLGLLTGKAPAARL